MQQSTAIPNLWQRLKPAADWLIDLVFPLVCFHCGRPDVSACADCRRELAATPPLVISRSFNMLDGVYATGLHEGVLRSAVQAFKYYDATWLADLLARRLSDILARVDLPVDALLPVPLHANKQKERGYNQAELLCERLAAELDMRCEANLLRRTRNTKQQANLSGAAERASNVQGAFEVVDDARGKSFLLVDDVATTGATLSDCARALRNGGATAVYGIVVSSPN
ncbi:MAG: ComF family protein [Chloroflexi bacterium]|nr:ComF family protein [Chloroflexota bacterium]MCY3582022.1 ComF family protein [Chloroflexota bacterium]MCY3716519.1 ComF family protein [Chloroflexota bacterium]MDE2651628.1 ComF family protein [Chloroflexota bacterium]MXX50237.1 ComF family protein [Chloroflexota bacterium]